MTIRLFKSVQFILVALVITSASTIALAGTECDLSLFGARGCITGIEDFDDQEAEQSQDKDQWCWAASISMIFNYYGYHVSQEEIVVQTYGRLVNLPATGKKIGENLKGKYKTKDNREFSVTVREYDLLRGKTSLNNNDILRSLEEGRPLLIGANGHAMVLTAVFYTRSPSGKLLSIIGGIVRDPWPGRGKRQLTFAELSPFYVADIRIEHQGNDDKTQERIEECIDSCFKQQEDCIDIANEEQDTCTESCNANICDRCSNFIYNDALYDHCERDCDRCTSRCDKAQEAKTKRCESKYDLCSRKCTGN
jgi:hypothetical protein